MSDVWAPAGVLVAILTLLITWVGFRLQKRQARETPLVAKQMITSNDNEGRGAYRRISFTISKDETFDVSKGCRIELVDMKQKKSTPHALIRLTNESGTTAGGERLHFEGERNGWWMPAKPSIGFNARYSLFSVSGALYWKPSSLVFSVDEINLARLEVKAELIAFSGSDLDEKMDRGLAAVNFGVQVIAPDAGDRVPFPLIVRGTLEQNLSRGMELWLMTMSDSTSDEFWPQCAAKIEGRSWHATLDRHATTDRDLNFAVYLLGPDGIYLVNQYRDLNFKLPSDKHPWQPLRAIPSDSRRVTERRTVYVQHGAGALEA